MEINARKLISVVLLNSTLQTMDSRAPFFLVFGMSSHFLTIKMVAGRNYHFHEEIAPSAKCLSSLNFAFSLLLQSFYEPSKLNLCT